MSKPDADTDPMLDLAAEWLEANHVDQGHRPRTIAAALGVDPRRLSDAMGRNLHGRKLIKRISFGRYVAKTMLPKRTRPTVVIDTGYIDGTTAPALLQHPVNPAHIRPAGRVL